MRARAPIDKDIYRGAGLIEPLSQHPHAINSLAQWHYREWHSFYPEETLADFIQDLQASTKGDPVPSTWVLIYNQEIIGSTSILERDMTTNLDLSPWLANVFIRPEFRAKGLGRFLINSIIDQALGLHLPQLYFFTEAHEGFYEQFGWRSIRQGNYNQAQVSIMRLDL